MSTQEQNTYPTDITKMSSTQLNNLLEQAYKAGASAERKGKHATPQILDNESLRHILSTIRHE